MRYSQNTVSNDSPKPAQPSANFPAHDPCTNPAPDHDPFACFHPVTAEWFKAVFDAPTAPQRLGWPVIARGESVLILAPTGTGKTLTAFLWCLDRLMLHPSAEAANRTAEEGGSAVSERRARGASQRPRSSQAKGTAKPDSLFPDPGPLIPGLPIPGPSGCR